MLREELNRMVYVLRASEPLDVRKLIRILKMSDLALTMR